MSEALGRKSGQRYSIAMPPQFEWSPWIPLNGSWLATNLPSQPGLYRVRRVGFDGIDYIGQTRALKIRAGMLRGVYREEMPYREPTPKITDKTRGCRFVYLMILCICSMLT